MQTCRNRGCWLAMAAGIALAGCGGGMTVEEEEELAAMQIGPEALPSSPTNRYADDPAAAELGRRLFFDRRMSADGEVGCVSCHDPRAGFSDARPVSLGVEGREGRRHSMPITAVAFQRFLLWDGLADSPWSQPLKALENEQEMDLTRVEVARFIAERYREDYEAIFGPLPDLAGLPARARPGLPAWDLLTAPQQDEVQRVFANVGKALEAYERRLLCADTRFDRWARGELELDDKELSGGAKFLRQGCAGCHAGPSFSDGRFHNVGIGSGKDEPDLGRAAVAEALHADPFNAAGAYSDDPAAGQQLLDTVLQETGTLGAFRTPTLRGVGQRRFFGHRGHREGLEDFIEDVYDDGPHMQASAVGELDPAARDVEVREKDDLLAFLRTLDCPPPPPELVEP
ncbi:cytochrome-c peroxidase [Sorangium sp. So ce1128]